MTRRVHASLLTAFGLLLCCLPMASLEAAGPLFAAAAGAPIAGGSLFELALPGTVIDQAAACPAAEPCTAWLALVGEVSEPGPDEAAGSGEPEPGPRRLLWLSLGDAEGETRVQLTEPVPWMPAEPQAILVTELGAAGGRQLLLGEPGQVWSLGSVEDPQAPVPLVRGQEFDLPAARRLLTSDGGGLVTAEVGTLSLWSLDSAGSLTRSVAAELPVAARRTRHGLELTSPPVASLGDDSGRTIYLIGPEDQGGGRLRTVVIEPRDGEAGTVNRWEAWAQLPGAEAVEQASFVRIEGRPALIALTHASDKVGVFDQKRLRVLPLSPDRTRAGAAPWLAVETTSHRWQRADVQVADWDGDGRDDLTVAQVKGLGGKGILLQVYLGKPGGFARKATKLRVDADLGAWRYSGDVDGDGLPDLLLMDDETLAIHTSGDRQRGRPVGESPRWRIELPTPPRSETAEDDAEVTVRVGEDGSGVEVFTGPRLPALADLDRDGLPELVFRRAGGRSTRLLVVRLSR